MSGIIVEKDENFRLFFIKNLLTKRKVKMTRQSIKKDLKSFVKIHKEMKEKGKELKVLRDQFKQLKPKVAEFMKSQKVEVLELGDFNVHCKPQRYAASMNKDFIAQSVCEFLKKEQLSDDPSVGNKFAEFVWNLKKAKGEDRDRVSIRAPRKRKAKSAVDEPPTKSQAVELDSEQSAEVEAL